MHSFSLSQAKYISLDAIGMAQLRLQCTLIIKYMVTMSLLATRITIFSSGIIKF